MAGCCDETQAERSAWVAVPHQGPTPSTLWLYVALLLLSQASPMELPGTLSMDQCRWALDPSLGASHSVLKGLSLEPSVVLGLASVTWPP